MTYTPPPKPTTTTRDWRELVENADNEQRHNDNLYPVVYTFRNGRQFRDSGPTKGVYEGS